MTAPTAPLRLARLRRSGAALGLAGALVLAPVAASAAPGDAVVVAAEETEAPGRRPIAETPRDRLGLLVLGALLAAAAIGTANARRQLRGERPTADGRFRWR
jgi:hypothetical protein